MKLIHLSGFDEEELLQYRVVVHHNAVEAIQSLVVGAKKLGISLDPQNSGRITLVEGISSMKDLVTPEIRDAIIVLWQDPGDSSVVQWLSV